MRGEAISYPWSGISKRRERGGVRCRAATACAFALTLAGGCGERFDYTAADVTGRVTYRGRPVTGGWVEFHPEPPTVGHLTTAKLRPDGTYRARRVAAGTLRVQIVRTRPLLPPEYRKGGSPLRATVVAGRTNQIDFHVERGAAATQSQPATTRRKPPIDG